MTLYSMPEWWLGLILFFLFATGSGLPRLFPIGGLHSSGVDPSSLDGGLDTGWHLVLPVLTLTLAYLAEYSLIMRSALLDEIGSDYLHDGPSQGTARRARPRPARLPQRAAADGHASSLNLGFVVVGCDHDRDRVLDPGLGLLTTDALRVPDSRCCRASSCSSPPA